jgi:hypothetical protein
MKYIGDGSRLFREAVESTDDRAQGNFAVLVEQPTGTGKTKLAYWIGMHRPVVLARVMESPTTVTAPWAALETYLRSEVKPDKAQFGVHLLVLSYIEWAVLVAEAVTTGGKEDWTLEERLRMLLLGQRNGTADRGVAAIFSARLRDLKAKGGVGNTEGLRKVSEALARRLANATGSENVKPCLFLDEAQALQATYFERLETGVNGTRTEINLFEAVRRSLLLVKEQFRCVAAGTWIHGLVPPPSLLPGSEGRIELKRFSHPSVVDVGVMYDVLSDLFHLDAPDSTPASEGGKDSTATRRHAVVPDELRGPLAFLRGRPIAFYDYAVPTICNRLFQPGTQLKERAQLLAFLRTTLADKAKEYIKDNLIERLDLLCQSQLSMGRIAPIAPITPATGGEEDPATHRGRLIVLDMAAAAVLDDGMYKPTKHEHESLLKRGLLLPSSTWDRAVVSAQLNDEPMLAAALQKFVPDALEARLRYLALKIGTPGHDSGRGDLCNTYMATKMMSRSHDFRAARTTSLRHVLCGYEDEWLPVDFNFPPALGQWTVHRLMGSIDSEFKAIDSLFSLRPTDVPPCDELSEMMLSRPENRFLHNVIQTAGPDGLLSACNGGKRAVVGIQTKTGKATLVQSLLSATPSLSFLSMAERRAAMEGKTMVAGNRKAYDSGVWLHRQKFVSLVQRHRHCFERQVRVVVSFGGFSAKCIAGVNAHNEDRLCEPIVLVHPRSEALVTAQPPFKEMEPGVTTVPLREGSMTDYSLACELPFVTKITGEDGEKPQFQAHMAPPLVPQSFQGE